MNLEDRVKVLENDCAIQWDLDNLEYKVHQLESKIDEIKHILEKEGFIQRRLS